MADKMPILFVGHGSPMNLVQDNTYTRSLAEWGSRLPLPQAIMVISAHWLTTGTFVTCMEQPRTIHDFYGFPDELYGITYPSPGDPEMARHVSEIVHKAPVGSNQDWGLDHGAWAVLKHLYPKAKIPVFQLSLDYSFNDWNPKPLQYHYDLALELAELRQEGILIIGSGNIVHNLSRIDFRNVEATPFYWAVEFDEQVKANLLSRNHQHLLHLGNMENSATLAVPTLDHYLPMIYIIALQGQDEPITFVHEGFQNRSISMRCFQIG
jgi:4,5-DOPA dioxygenase extradiol